MMKIADYILIGILSLISIFALTFQIVNKNDSDLAAIVQYGSEQIMVIDLSKIDKESVHYLTNKKAEYNIVDNIGVITMYQTTYPLLQADMVIEFRINSIRVEKESSPLNICSKQGWVSDDLYSIVCLPNRITISMVPMSEVQSIIDAPPIKQ